MKTRSQSKSKNEPFHPYRKQASKASASKAQPTVAIAEAVIPRVFLVGEPLGGSGWVVQADSPQQAFAYFQRDVIKSDIPSTCHSPAQISWDEYLDLESRSDSKRPFYMQTHELGGTKYYVEALTFPGARTAWLPATFQ